MESYSKTLRFWSLVFMNYNHIAFAMIAIIWGTSASIILKIESEAPTYFICLLVLLCSSIFTLPIAYIRTQKKIFKDVISILTSEHIKLHLTCGALGFFIYPLCYFHSLHSGFEIQANVVNYLWPFFASAIGVIIGTEISNKKKLFGVSIGLVGGLISTINIKQLNPNIPNETSIFLQDAIPIYIVMLFGAFCYGLYTAIYKKHQKNWLESLSIHRESLFFFYMLVGLFLFISLFSFKMLTTDAVDLTMYDIPSRSFVFILIYALVNFSIGYFLWFYLIENNSVSRLSLAAFLIPVASTVILALVGGSEVKLASMIGLAIIVVGIYVNEEVDKYINPFTSFVVCLFYFIAMCYFIKPSEVINNTNNNNWNYITVSISIFSLFAVFLMNRLAKIVHQEEISVSGAVFKIDSIIQSVQHSEETRNALIDFRNKLIIFFSSEVPPNFELIAAINNDYDTQVVSLLSSDTNFPRGSGILEEIKDSMNQWAYSSGIRVTIYEWCFLVSLCIFIVAMTFLVRTGGLVEDVFFVIISTSLTTIVLSIRDYSMRSPTHRRLSFNHRNSGP